MVQGQQLRISITLQYVQGRLVFDADSRQASLDPLVVKAVRVITISSDSYRILCRLLSGISA